MTTASRIWLSAGFLGAALAVQAVLLLHMALGPSNSYPDLRQPFDELPTSLRAESASSEVPEWVFVSHPAEKEIRSRLPFVPVDLSFRYCQAGDLVAECYIVHSANGEDRKHHPDICIREVQRLPEDKTGDG